MDWITEVKVDVAWFRSALISCLKSLHLFKVHYAMPVGPIWFVGLISNKMSRWWNRFVL